MLSRGETTSLLVLLGGGGGGEGRGIFEGQFHSLPWLGRKGGTSF